MIFQQNSTKQIVVLCEPLLSLLTNAYNSAAAFVNCGSIGGRFTLVVACFTGKPCEGKGRSEAKLFTQFTLIVAW